MYGYPVVFITINKKQPSTQPNTLVKQLYCCITLPVSAVKQSSSSAYMYNIKIYKTKIAKNNVQSSVAQRILNTGHAYGYIEDTMTILHNIGKGPHMNTLERFHSYEISKQGMHLHDTFTDIINPIFETLTQAYG
jgi:hypothetical protein